MHLNTLFQIRLTGVLVEKEKILLVKQSVSPTRSWSLPGGRLEHGESLEDGVRREIYEETGLEVKVKNLIYICENPAAVPPLVHITFMLERVGGEIHLPTNEFDENPIYDVKMINIVDLCEYGFSEQFMNIVKGGFSDSGSYKGLKSAIGL